ncbi:MAG: CHAD domain-containing protein [Pirellulales bacterium]|nr:CHAD domain-containing protein [Pirellulales bacterium]
MSRQSKWFAVADPQMPVLLAARDCLRDRLRWLWRLLRVAAHSDAGQPEAVHQLRVASRRAQTALSMFRSLANTSEYAWIEKQVKKIRRSVGVARDADVLAEHYRHIVPQLEKATAAPVKLLLKRLQKHCDNGRLPLYRLAAKLKRKRFPERSQRCLRQILRLAKKNEADHTRPPFQVFAEQALQELWGEYRAAARMDLTQIDELHNLRLQTKTLRYAMELLAGAFAPGFREVLYPRVAELQERLGLINDHAVAIGKLRDIQANIEEKGLQRWLEGEILQRQGALQQAHTDFLAWWELEQPILFSTAEGILQIGPNAAARTLPLPPAAESASLSPTA